MKIKFCFNIILFWLLPNLLLAQTIKGKITDELSNDGVAYVTVQADAKHKTISNENGEFELAVSSLPCDLTISHISYQPIKIKANDIILNLKLKAIVQNLEEVVVGNHALSLMKSAYTKAIKIVDESYYAKAFFRQIAYEADRPVYLNEIFFNADWKNYSLIKWLPTESRYLKNDSHVSYSNLSFSVFALSGYLSNSYYAKPLSSKLDSLYTFKIKSTFKSGDDEIAIISCKLKVKYEKAYFEGDYYLNTETYNVLKIDGTIKNFGLTSKGVLGAKLKEANLISQYSLNSENKSILDFSVLTLKSRMAVLGLGTKNLELYSTLYVMDYSNTYNKDLKQIQNKTNDVKTTQNMVYNADFWRSNPTIKRTAKEEEAIKILEEASTIN
ncbi:carboxypeptidase-like regulatory domain-containing protein [Pedobacter sp. KBS0701]|uniref:carboxypeptidase-like regulatory domain-containing protein n=1 Tax=Pedobacter sp. KBS0701 TaxID=2578106 RepID=UPI00110F634D|nr:carboxypeptidase-like regulatory domain-containing protein [Pedobacter sp. KBS0701]QDW25413.1 carboxypeptidase-like regulatory domain-containing protein [Pedobacter sp. KBS0701]